MLFFKQGAQGFNAVFIKHNAGGIVRRIDDDSLCVLVDCAFNRGKIGQKRFFVRGNNLNLHACFFGKNAVLGKVRSKNNQLIARLIKRIERNRQRSRRACGHIKILFPEVGRVGTVEIFGKRLSDGIVAHCRGIAVKLG